jgi:hypothetical protein
MEKEHYSLVVAYNEGLDEGQLDLRLYEPVTEAAQVFHLFSEDKWLLVELVEEEETLPMNEISWFRIVSPDAHLARYVRNGEIYDCEWDEQGEAIDDSDTIDEEV